MIKLTLSRQMRDHYLACTCRVRRALSYAEDVLWSATIDDAVTVAPQNLKNFIAEAAQVLIEPLLGEMESVNKAGAKMARSRLKRFMGAISTLQNIAKEIGAEEGITKNATLKAHLKRRAQTIIDDLDPDFAPELLNPPDA